MANRILRRDPGPWEEITLMFLDDSAMIHANQTAFGRDYATDVISYRYDPIPGELQAPAGGDVLVNVQRALERRPADPDRELALYIAHGLHHLTGARDDTPERRRAMRARENAWLRQARHQDLLAPGRLLPSSP